MACRAIFDSPDAIERSQNLGGALFLGLCAANIAPGARYVGSLLFSLYSLQKEAKNSYITATIVGTTLEKTAKVVHTTTKTVWKKAIAPICRDIIFPAIEHVAQDIIAPLAETVLVPAAQKVVRVCSAALSKIELPMNPAWYGAATLLVAGAAYRGASKIITH